jgi:hypothetical protein
MPTQTTDGWSWLLEQTRRFSRTVTNPGAVTDDLIAWAYSEAESQVYDLALESDIPWVVRNQTIDDTASSFGTQIEHATTRYFIVEDLGITDLVRVRHIWRVDPNNTTMSQPLLHSQGLFDTGRVRDIGATLTTWGREGWIEDGDYNSSGAHDMSLLIFNKGLAMAGGYLKLNYWFCPARVEADDFYEVDSSGNLSKAPTLPRKTWSAIMNYAHLIILETIEDQYKANALWRRFGGSAGITSRLRSMFQRFQDSDPEYVRDAFVEEGF